MRFPIAALAFAGVLCAVPAKAESGEASVYAVKGRDPYAGRTMACGGRALPGNLTAAHKTLPCGTRILVTNRRNNKSVVVTVKDRGPYVRGRVIDLTLAGSRAIGCGDLCPVTVTRL